MHSLVEYLDCLYLLAIVNNAGMDICVHAFVWTYVFIYLGYITRIGIAGTCGDPIFNSLQSCQSNFQISYIPISNVWVI